MHKILLAFLLLLLLMTACSATDSTVIRPDAITPPLASTATQDPHQISSISPPQPNTTTPELIHTPWPPVTGPEPSYRVGAFYYPWYFNLEVDGIWVHWEQDNYQPPVDIASDFYPMLGAYSMSDPFVLAQHFAWLRQAGVGFIISSWWGKNERSDRILELMFDVADRYGIKIAFHIEPYDGRSAEQLGEDIEYIYNQYGDLPAFFWTTETSCYSPDDRPKGLFFMWASVVPDGNSAGVSPDYWQKAIDDIHQKLPGSIILTDQNDPRWITEGHFDGSYNYGVLDADQVGYNWAFDLPSCAWYVPGINPGFSAWRIGYPAEVDTPRLNGATYADRWERMFAVGIEPSYVAITTFNEWHEGTQIEPAVSNITTSDGSPYLDYETLPPDGYLTLTRKWSQKYLTYQWPSSELIRIMMQTTSDWTDLYLTKGAIWYASQVVSTEGNVTEAGLFDGRFNLQQPLEQAESGNTVEVIFSIQMRDVESEDPIVFEIERGGLGMTWVELHRLIDEEWVTVAAFSWGGHSAGDRNISSFQVIKEVIFDEFD